jgi:transcriptional regulator with XRE-family HTH domain
MRILGDMNTVVRILKLLEGTGMDQGELESAALLSHGRVSKWKKGIGQPTAKQALRIARILNVPLEWLVDEEAGETPPETPPEVKPAYTAEEQAIIGAYRASGLTLDEAARHLFSLAIEKGRVRGGRDGTGAR